MNPIKIEIERESVEEVCDRHNLSNPFFVNGVWRAFPHCGVMAIPLILECKQYLYWDEEYPESTPFEIEVYCEPSVIPWAYKRIWFDRNRAAIICVRTDVYPLFWIYWWFYFRVVESLRLSRSFIFRILEIWGLAQVPAGSIPGWRDIKIIKRLSKISDLCI